MIKLPRLALISTLALVLSTPTHAAIDTLEARPEIAFQAEADPGTIIVKTSERKLYLVTAPGKAMVYEIAVGKPSEQWFGKSWVSRKRRAPTWIPTPSMRERNPRLPQSIGPGPSNPLGERAINLGWGAYRIHGTNKPRSIGSAASAGCFRMRNADVKDLFERVHVGAEVRVLR
ncbi:L,D-transpeptidase [Fulvimarina sp. MAC3]|uniref:L,D-transpeptidase n=1 Tax=Fulvimarina sp. MAC3 TaxID=3148887 RepID=UPI0031FCF3C3